MMNETRVKNTSRGQIEWRFQSGSGPNFEEFTLRGRADQLIDLDCPETGNEPKAIRFDWTGPNDEPKKKVAPQMVDLLTPEPVVVKSGNEEDQRRGPRRCVENLETCKESLVIDLVTPPPVLEPLAESSPGCASISPGSYAVKQRSIITIEDEELLTNNAEVNDKASSRQIVLNKRPGSTGATSNRKRHAGNIADVVGLDGGELAERYTSGTEIFMYDGHCKIVDELQIGDEILTADGSCGVVRQKSEELDEAFTIKQQKNHYIHFYDESRDLPYGLFETTCFEGQVLLVETYLRLKRSIRRDKENQRRVLILTVNDFETKDGRLIKLARDVEKLFPAETSDEVVENYIKSFRGHTENNSFVRWKCEVGDLKYLGEAARASTRLLLLPLAFERPTLLPFLEKEFMRKVSEKELEAMAWLIGFWIGDGCRVGATFALHSEDHEVNGRLEENAKIWGMTYVKKHCKNKVFGATGTLHTFQNGRRRWNVGNPFIAVLKGLLFYENGKINDKKNVPHFMRTEHLMVREAFLAGLIDSDGYSLLVDGFLCTSITTVYPPIRDGIQFITRSLGLNVSTHVQPACPVAGTSYIKKKQWQFQISNGTNPKVLRSLLDRCSAQRKRHPKEASYTQRKSLDILREDNTEAEGVDTPELFSCDILQDRFVREKRAAINEEYSEEWSDDELIADDETLDGTTDNGEPCITYENQPISPISDETNFDCGAESIVHNYSRQFFQSIPLNQKVKVIKITHSTKQKLIPEHQIITEESLLETGETKKIDIFTETCYSCGRENSNPWKNVPWQGLNCYKLCRSCYDYYLQSHTRCYNCNRVATCARVNEKAQTKELKVTNILQDGKSLKGYSCDECQGVLISDSAQKPRIRKKVEPETRECNYCGPVKSIKWHTIPWHRSNFWWHKCGQRFLTTKTICTNQTCRYILSNLEIRRQQKAKLDPKCTKCGSQIEKKT
ncbi:LANO_0H18778g1_1 [Lachancea nothofagi CBS 11611]|uniref:LANO_0H18778g1_1 n=1 Tax=Lachancea nothofagi CBS 11611 TaxID=1266666 RepID=A0A1G4KN40_9SACH|nr:LANO_0H18778g1_1 [Lachancea nothofagi CBS 11611]